MTLELAVDIYMTIKYHTINHFTLSDINN